MIVRPRPHWFRMLFLWKGSVLYKLVPRLLIIFVIAVVAVLCREYSRDAQYTDLNPQPFTLLGVSLAIFLGFRDNVSYDRFWEARRLCSTALIAARALLRQALTLTGWDRSSAAARRFASALSTLCTHCAISFAILMRCRSLPSGFRQTISTGSVRPAIVQF